MRLLAFSGRTAKEILRDPLNLFFGLGFPLVLIGLLTAIQANIPVPMFELDNLTPGITVFGLSFMTLFAAVLISKDRESALLQRLYTTPLTASDFIFGYTLPILPIAVAQGVICYIAAALLGLKLTITVLYALLFLIPVSLFYIALWLICGSVFNSKQVGGICGALLTNLSAWMSGIWFDVDLVGGVFKKIANALPFIHAVELERAVFSADYSGILPHLWWVLGYTIVAVAGAVLLFAADEKTIIVADKGGRYNDNKIILQCNHKICAWNYSCRATSVSACGNSAISQRLVAYGSFVCSYVCRRYCDDVQKPPIIK